MGDGKGMWFPDQSESRSRKDQREETMRVRGRFKDVDNQLSWQIEQSCCHGLSRSVSVKFINPVVPFRSLAGRCGFWLVEKHAARTLLTISVMSHRTPL